MALCFCQNSVFPVADYVATSPQLDNEKSDNSTCIITNLKIFPLMYNVVIYRRLHCPSRYWNPFDVSEISEIASVSKNPNTR
jgi:hypothetical protein